MEHVKGTDKGNVFLFTLSTCIWCKKTKKLFKDLGVEYTYEDVDLLEGEESDKAEAEMDKYSSNPSFPLIVVDGKKFNMGFDEDKIRNRFEK
jgi:glutaredoxin-like protein NrdH